MKRHLKLSALAALAATLVALVALAPPASAAPPATRGIAVPATCTDLETGDPVACTLTLVGFTTQDGAVAAVFRLVSGTQSQLITVPVLPGTTQQGGTCTLLDLTIGPIHLELLGLVLDTNTIHLTLKAQRGTLLGDLLCGLFFGDPAGAATTLNQLLRQGLIQLA